MAILDFKPAVLVLAGGRVFHGEAFGADGKRAGEVVFHTGLTGYQEILTDPSYSGQIVVMTYPEIGNTGVNSEDAESRGVFLSGFVVKHLCPTPSNFRSRQDLDSYLRQHGVAGISGIDTRALVRELRTHGAQMGIIQTGEADIEALRKEAAGLPGMAGKNLVDGVTTPRAYQWTEGRPEMLASRGMKKPSSASRRKLVAYDFGIKLNILRTLTDLGFEVTVVPASTPAKDVLAMNPSGVFLSNGPGDPEVVDYAIANTRELLGKVPVFGICLGHQILALALGGQTYKLRFGHHGGNHPVMNLDKREVEITSQNHGFAVNPDTLSGKGVVSHINLYDHTVEGIEVKNAFAFSVQYHPEACPGPHDAEYLFQKFRAMVDAHRDGHVSG
ncbi:MAG: Carbamoyl-phosphate synthase small chain [Myxococcota bacterium]|nr:Carbamoyl-phosphate synthase small chain [Myxococcota bacterium]